MAKKIDTLSWLQSTAIRVTRIHFYYIAAFLGSIIVFDSWNLLTNEAVIKFWTVGGALLVLNTLLWYISRIKFSKDLIYISSVQILVLADIVFASLVVYWQRGLASNAVALFAVPIITAAALRSRTMLMATAALSAAAYSISAVRYFYAHYGESFRVELYGEVGFYSAIFFVIAWLLLAAVSPSSKEQ
ncbi:hypothetical protein H0X09_02440 [Candidatus Saccharibacteria bacterium]|nr:hypothetical protein [Candidatus Saccharibacteria bacterium]